MAVPKNENKHNVGAGMETSSASDLEEDISAWISFSSRRSSRLILAARDQFTARLFLCIADYVKIFMNFSSDRRNVWVGKLFRIVDRRLSTDR